MQIDEDIYPDNVKLRDFEDTTTLRNQIFDNTLNQFQSSFPKKHGKYRVELDELSYADDKDYSLEEQKDALMKDKFLARRLRGTFRLYEDETNTLLDEKPNMTLMRVPYLTQRGTVIHNGNEYSILNQARLESGIYARKKANGEVEAHVNPERGKGKAFRVNLEPKTGLLKLEIGGARLSLYSLFKDLGISEEEMREAWGDEIYDMNRKKYDARVFNKAYERLVSKYKRTDDADTSTKRQAIMEALQQTKVKAEILEKTLPSLFS